jgi:hypothetical protein
MALYPEGTAPLPMDDVQRAANKANELSRQTLGQNGCIATDSTATGNFVAIQCIQDCSFDLLTTVSGDGDFFFLVDNGVTIPAGTIFYGAFTNISSLGGIYIAYKAG